MPNPTNDAGSRGNNVDNANASANQPRPYDDGIYRHAFAAFPVPGLCPCFATGATLLRIARRELRTGLVEDGERVVEDFYGLLDRVEAYLARRDARNAREKCKDRGRAAREPAHESSRVVIEVEGLDGSGKTTLCRSLAGEINKKLSACGSPKIAVSTKTPPASLKAVRPLFDHRGGTLARVFYAVSNYVLEYEIEEAMPEEVAVVVVDRWYASTLAYSVAYRSSDGDETRGLCGDPDRLDDSVFRWPRDLGPMPGLLLVLGIGASERRARVQSRRERGGGASAFNPWDDRLEKDEALGDRILRTLERVHGRGMKVEGIDAGRTPGEVVGSALAIAAPLLEAFFPAPGTRTPPPVPFRGPLGEWARDARAPGPCGSEGPRAVRPPRNRSLGLAFWPHPRPAPDGGSSPVAPAPPVLETAWLDRITAGAVRAWTAGSGLLAHGHAGGAEGSTRAGSIRMASVLWAAGDSPGDPEWRAEGFLEGVTPAERELGGFRAPGVVEGEPRATPHAMVRFVPLRARVLRGGPGGGRPECTGWTRNHTEPPIGGGNGGGWTEEPAVAVAFAAPVSYRARPFCLVLAGCHAAGKTTLGRRLARLLGWRFDPELGEVLRNSDSGNRRELLPGGHFCGDGSSPPDDPPGNGGESPADAWDDLVFEAETTRDADSLEAGCCRVVETWHVGNEGWHALRRAHGAPPPQQQQQQQQQNHHHPPTAGGDADRQRYRDAVSKHARSAVVVLVRLDLPSPGIVLDRRKGDASARERLPLEDEAKDCWELFRALKPGSTETQTEGETTEWGVPTLRVDNGGYGEEAMAQTMRTILSFVEKHYYKRAVPLSG